MMNEPCHAVDDMTAFIAELLLHLGFYTYI